MDDNNFEIINGKKYKKCKENQIRNPITKRCIYKDKKIANELLLKEIKERPQYLYKSIKIRTKKKKLSLSPQEYNEKRFYIYKKIVQNIENNIEIGENLIIKDKLEYGDNNIYSSYLKKKPKYIIASKIVVENKKSENEINYLKMLNKAVLENKCPHFPMLYNYYNNIKIKDLDILPKILRVEHNSYKIILSELADGNLKKFIIKKNNSDNIYINALTQIFFSLIFFYKETMSFHNNSIWDNFVYKMIKKGGYYHYEIMGDNYYLENVGYLWMINDFDNCVEFNKSIDKNIMLRNDFLRIIYSFLPSTNNGLIKDNDYKISQNTLNKILKLFNVVKYYSEKYTLLGMKIYISKILNILVINGFIKTSVNPLYIINKISYKIRY
jgi:hypothetical protein